jgi:hypothetical protein
LPPSLIGRQSNLLVDIRPDDRGELKRADVEQRKASQSTADSLSKSLRNVLARDPAKLNCGHAKGADGELDLKSFRRL